MILEFTVIDVNQLKRKIDRNCFEMAITRYHEMPPPPMKMLIFDYIQLK